MSERAILICQNVTVTYRETVALDDCSFAVDKGQYVCLVGANGSGKSSFLSAALGLTPLKKGTIKLVCGKENIAYVPQADLAPRDFPATVGEVVLLGTQQSGKSPRYTKEDRAAAKNAMEQMRISNLSGRQIGALSGGQRQRVFLARALCRNPELLLLDEPCAGLDDNAAGELYTILDELHQNGTTLIMATHAHDRLNRSDIRIIELARRIIYDGSYEGWKNKN